MERRKFLGSLAAIPLALKVKLNPGSVAARKVSENIPVSAKYGIPYKQLEPGWYNTKIIDVSLETSETGRDYYKFALQTEDKNRLSMLLSAEPQGSWQIKRCLDKVGIEPDEDGCVELSEMIGKELKVQVMNHELPSGRKINITGV